MQPQEHYDRILQVFNPFSKDFLNATEISLIADVVRGALIST